MISCGDFDSNRHLLMIVRGLWLSSWLLASVVQAATEASALRWRVDLQHKAHLFCAEQKDMRSLWQAGIYDTLFSLRTLPRTEKAQQLAYTQAQREGGAGYAYGNCKDDRSWVLSVSAPYAALLEGRKIKLDADLQHHCSGLRARYAPDGLRHTQTVDITRHALSLPARGRGLVAVNCLSRHPHRTGPRLLYVFPVGKPVMQAPLLPQKIRRGQERQAVQTWVAALRAKMGLTALREQATPHTTERFSVIHDRTELHAVKRTLLKQHLRLLGENRARGHTLAEALTMLWVSPFHRDLLLHKSATYLMVDVAQQREQVLVTMLVNGDLLQPQRKH